MGIIFFTKVKNRVSLRLLAQIRVSQVFWEQIKTVYLQGPHSLRPCILRPCCTTKKNFVMMLVQVSSIEILQPVLCLRVILKQWKNNFVSRKLCCYKSDFVVTKKWDFQIICCYLENRVVQEKCKQKTACFYKGEWSMDRL